VPLAVALHGERRFSPLDLALRMLARRDRTEREVRRALEARGVSPREVGRVLGRLRRLGYIDDRRFAIDRSERLQERGYGSHRIRRDLEEHGIPEELAESVLPGREVERAIAERLLRERFGETPIRDPECGRRAARFLVGRGFSDEVVDSLISVWES
jgi:regulatory protein